MLALGIETTCDETSCAVVKDSFTILSNVVSSQIDLHSRFGGVVPELACRRHFEALRPITNKALQDAGVNLKDIDLICVAKGPGLVGALLLGLNFAKSLSWGLNRPLIGVNHIEAHIFAAMMSHPTIAPSFPSLGVVLSGGHSSIVYMQDIGQYQLLSETVDDAIGEAFDKVAKMMSLPYPGGPQIEKLAQQGNPSRFTFKPSKVKAKPLHFSFSGIKTNVLYLLKGQNQQSPQSFSQQEVYDLAASFQDAVFRDVIEKVKAAAKQTSCNTVYFGGGVTNNSKLRELFSLYAPHLSCRWPTPSLSLDNAAMIAGLGSIYYQQYGIRNNLSLEAQTRIPF